MPRKKIISVGKCRICGRKHYAHLGGWVVNGANKLLCYELDYEKGDLRTDCFERARAEGRAEMDATRKGLRPRDGEMDTAVLLGLLEGDLQE